jgi:hypothetical protein
MEYKILENKCWRCTSHCLSSAGYVKLTINGRQTSGHRFMYEKKYGKIKSEVLRHTCDNSWCINPEHLIEGTHKDNVQDRVIRGRSATGVKNGRSKLNEKEVLKILSDIETPKMHLAKKYNVDPKVIRDIKQGKTWKFLTGL